MLAGYHEIVRLADGTTFDARVTAYAFRSIEQLRYDFERDAQNAVDRD
jgi:hypothetical protein